MGWSKTSVTPRLRSASSASAGLYTVSPRSRRMRRMVGLVKALINILSCAARRSTFSTAVMFSRPAGTLVPKLTQTTAFFILV